MSATTTPESCYHCGEPLPRAGSWSAAIDGLARPMCCAGCAAVAEAIVIAGLEDYYRHRSAPAQGAAAVPAELASLAIYDEPELQERFTRSADASGSPCLEATLAIDGMRCGACVWLIERALAGVPGVLGANVNLATERAVVRWDPERTPLSRILERCREIGYQVAPFDVRLREAAIARTSRAQLRRLFVAGFGMMQVMMYAFPAYTAAPGEIESGYATLLHWASLLLTLPVVFYSAQPFFAGALRDLRALRPGMDVPVAISVAVAFAASVWATLSGRGEVYFDSVTMFVFLLLGSRHLEWIARRRAARALDAMAAAAPEQVRRLLPGEAPGGATEAVPAARVGVDDLIEVASGERVALDGVIAAGRTSVDLSLLTGESVPARRVTGDEVPGGALNAGAPVTLRVLRPAAESTLSSIERLAERSSQDKPRVAQLADRAATWFVAVLLALTLVVLIVWWQLDPERALPVALAVLIVSCPCALSMATPAALAAASGGLLRRHVLITRGQALEALASCTDVVFDKTGTLTTGKPTVVALMVADGIARADALAWAARLEDGSAHPFGRAICELAAGAGSPAATAGDGPAKLLERIAEPGSGVGATLVTGTGPPMRLRLGSARWCGIEPAQETPQGVDASWSQADSTVFMVELPEGDGQPGSPPGAAVPRLLASFALRDRLRPEAQGLVAMLARSGVRSHLASGDREPTVAHCAAELGIASWVAAATPDSKLSFVRTLQREGARVLMVGDGINDAPVMAAADVSVAVGGATTLARVAADAIVLTPSLDGVVDLVTTARRCLRVVRQNLVWALAYNLVAIPAAACGLVPPWLAALGMAGSSLLVAANALTLWSWKHSTS